MDPQQIKDIDREEFIKEAVAKLRYFSQLYGINSLFIVGGYCRSLYFNKLADLNDIDVASAYDHQAIQMAGLFASEILGTVPQIYERSQAAMVPFQSGNHLIKIEFQGKSPAPYMYNQEIRDWLHDNNIDDVPLMHNIYGRDFTINALIFSLANENMYDLTDRAIKDLDEGKIVSLLPPQFLVKYNPLAALRAIRFAIYYNFQIDETLGLIIKESLPWIKSSLSEERISKELLRILTIDADKAICFLKKYKLDRLLLSPLIREKIKH